MNADLASDMSASTFGSLREVWLRTLRYSGMPTEKVDSMREAFGRVVALLPLHEVEANVEAGGFESPVLFFQGLLIHAWYSTVK